MEERNEEDEGDLLSSLSSLPPPHRKAYSYSHQLGTANQGTARPIRDVFRNQSLKEERIPNLMDSGYNYYDSSDDDDLYTSSVSSSSSNNKNSTVINNQNHNNVNYNNVIKIGDFQNSNSNPNLDRNSSNGSKDERKCLPEFIGTGGDRGIFKLPLRGAVHPGRPASIELRPHPLRETQVGVFLRTIVCTDNSLWAGQESGLRYWNFNEIYESGCGIGKRERRGDEETSPFYESVQTSPTMCLVFDAGNKFIWSGHKDGRIRAWKIQQNLDGNSFNELFSWAAHRGPVLSMVMTSYGDLWSGAEGGVIKIWPWESIEKSIALTPEERHMSASLDRSYIDLRTQVTVNGVCSISNSDVKYLLSDNCRAKVWSAGSQSFSLWDARTRELLKVFNIDGQVENRVDLSSLQDTSIEEDMKVKLVSGSKKEKPQGSFSFFQRSRNALMGAADAVRRVAKGALDEHRKTEAILLTVDGMVWTGCANGFLVQWDGNGNRIQDFQHHSASVQCFCTLGTRIWVGYVSGTVQVLDLKGNLLGEWVAHCSPIIKMAVGYGYVFTLANHGGIRGWSITSPSPFDKILRSELASKETHYKKLENLKILAGTWNVGQERASHDSLLAWLGSAASEVGIVVVGLQEVEMGAGFLAMSAAKETVGLEGSSIGQWWMDNIGRILDEGTTFERGGSRQLAGLLIVVWVRKCLMPHIGDIEAAAVPCGFGRAIGNKGAVGLRMRVYGRAMCFVNCHLAAHLEAVTRRNADFDHIYRNMIFNRPSNLLNAAAAGVSSVGQMLRVTNASGTNSEEGKPELSEADMVVFLGDFNYRLHGISYDEARDFISQRCFDWLREKDQLRAEMKAGKVFQGMREGVIRFPPTYKFEKNQAGLAGYDSGEKKRIPAWCDRIIYRDSRTLFAPVSECNLECPVVSSILHYDACMDATDSDHKPVRCIFSVDVAQTDDSIRRQDFGKIIESNKKIKSLLGELCKVPETIVSTNNIILQNKDTSLLRITNKSGKDEAVFEIVCEGQSTIKEDGETSDRCTRGSFGFPRWLEVTPAAGVIKPGHVAEISMHHEEFHTLEEFVDGVAQSWLCEDTRDKEVVLLVIIRGSCSTKTGSHRICVRNSSSSLRVNSKRNDSAKNQANVLHRSVRPINGSSDVAEDLRNLHMPS
ncbi:hypothetical protein MKW98_006984 [Papaver atlanticum]|uniref:Inositol polyphosphate-related phosphatase domain-containing protein n=1 Tax=Papaver atlanticum TaxID=357466 RepID=A0AAD4SVG6_9MAGN|nr:hypothetical protein MKW98_006984 [Papaver atlanticum]